MADDLSTPWIEKWACPLCTFQNPISTPTCEMCETDRPNNEPSQVVPSDTAEIVLNIDTKLSESKSLPPRLSVSTSNLPPSTVLKRAETDPVQYNQEKTDQIRRYNSETKIQVRQRSSSTSAVDRAISQAHNRVATFIRQISLGVEQEIYCVICLMNSPQRDSYALIECGHRFCRGCIQQYVRLKIIDAEVIDVICPFMEQNVDCRLRVTEQDVHNLLSDDADIMEKFNRFKMMKQHDNYRQCPFCQFGQLGNPRKSEIVCSSCGNSFCYFHSNAHQGKTCKQYEREQREVEILTQAEISAISKKCPGCKRNIEKSGGCNHMRCVSCGTNFCWLCGSKVQNATYPRHYAWWNIFGCPGVQMRESCQGGRLTMCAYRLLYMLSCPVGCVCALVCFAIVFSLAVAWFAIGLGVAIACCPITFFLVIGNEEARENIPKCICAPCLVIVDGGLFDD